MTIRLLRATCLALVLGVGTATAAPPTAPQLSPSQAARAEAIDQNLRCPLCDTGEPIADSRADISVKMRESVREQIAAGKTDSEIYTYFAVRYGQFVLLDPPKTGRNLLLWGAPLLALVGGGAVWWNAVRRRKGAAAPAEADDAPFDPYLDQVRRDTGGRA